MWGNPHYNRASLVRGDAVADAQIFRQAWGEFATGVAVVTTIQPDGQVHGMAANGINSVSLEPPLVLVCVDHNRNTYPLIRSTRRFAINILSEDQQAIGENYSRPPEQRTGDAWESFSFTERGSAIVDKCLAWMDCHVVDEHVAGDHTIFIGEVDEIRVNSGRPLIFFEGEFGRLG